MPTKLYVNLSYKAIMVLVVFPRDALTGEINGNGGGMSILEKNAEFNNKQQIHGAIIIKQE